MRVVISFPTHAIATRRSTLGQILRRSAAPIATLCLSFAPSANAQQARDAQPLALISPSGNVEARITASPQEGLTYTISWDHKQLAAPAHIGLKTDRQEVGRHTSLGKAVFAEIDERYPFFGAKAVAVNHARTVSIPCVEADGTRFTVEARAYDDGFAWRILLPEPAHVLAETSTFSLPAGEVWFGERDNDWKLKSYAGEFHHVDVDKLPTISSQGPIQTPPLVVEMPQGQGFALITEAALADFSGMRLRTLGHRTLAVDFTEGAEGFSTTGPATTPWRVIMLCPDLNCLVNNTLTQNLNSAPDPKLFPDTSYIRPGRSVWRWGSRNTGTAVQEHDFVTYASDLGYEYTYVDHGWEAWPTPWPSLTSLVEYARSKHVNVFAWKTADELWNPANDYAELRAFLDKAKAAGVTGLKIDYINGESKVKVDFERKTLALAAERRLMIDFHGIQKPTGEERTFPNGLTREGVRGMELNHMKEGPIPASHNAALPFTRLAIGPGDYTPLLLNWPGYTTWTHQLAMPILLSAPILCIAEDPEFLMKDPDAVIALPIIKAFPATWDETIVLPGSRIGGLVTMARRKGNRWFIASINGGSQPTAVPSLPASLKLEGNRMTVITSPYKRAFAKSSTWPQATLLQPGDGVVAMLELSAKH